MLDQHTKYKGSKKVKLVTACFHGDNRGYSYLCDIEDVEVGDVGIALMKDGEMKCLAITAVKSSDEIIPNPPFKKYAWICDLVRPDKVHRYQHIDDDVGVVQSDFESSAVKEEPKQQPRQEVDDVMDSIFGKL